MLLSLKAPLGVYCHGLGTTFERSIKFSTLADAEHARLRSKGSSKFGPPFSAMLRRFDEITP